MVESLHKRLLLISVALIMAFGLLDPALAFADEGGGGSHSFGGSYPTWGTVWYSNTNNDSDNMYGVVAYTHWDAALFCLGYNDGSEDFSNLFTPSMKAKLLEGNNAYQQFANKFKVGKPEMGGSGIVGGIFSPEIDFAAAWSSAKELYGETYCYSARYGVAERSNAKSYVQSVLAEGDGGSGGGTVTAGDMIVSGTDCYIPIMPWGGGWTPPKSIGYVQTPKSQYDKIKAFADDNGMKVYAFICNGGDLNTSLSYQDSCVTPFVIAFDEDNVSFDDENYTISFDSAFDTVCSNRYAFDKNNSGRILSSTVNGKSINYVVANSYNSTYSINAGVWDVQVSGATNGIPNRWTFQPIYYASEVVEGGGGDEPVEPPVTWPDPPTPVTPNPPEVPTPPDPTPPEPPDPTPPDPPTPWVPIPGPDDDPITGEDFQDLLDALAEHCQHIRDAMSDNFEQLWTNQSDLLVTEFASTRDTLTDNLQWLGNDVIAQGFTDLNGYLNDLFEWLAEQMEFNLNVNDSPYDDSSVLYWLKRIWAKLGTGDINIRPTDPVSDNDEWWSWLLQLMDNFVGFLLGFGLDKLGDVGSALQSLTGKFPFSLPWDLAALFGLLVAPPQTPAVDFPCYTVGLDGIQQVGSYHLSLADYNDAWEQVRWLERVSFCILLIKSSDFFTSLLGKVFGK